MDMHARPITKTPAGGRHRSTTTGRWRSAFALLLLLPTMAVIGAQAATPAAGADVCPGEQVEIRGETKTVTYTAPAGYLVSGWCVKAGTTIEVITPLHFTPVTPRAAIAEPIRPPNSA